MPRIIKPLTAAQVKNAKAQDKPYKLYDGGGLFLLGHLCYVTGLLNLHPPGSIHLLIFTAALAGLLGLLLRLRKRFADRLLFYGVCVYAAALAALLAAALPLPFAGGSPGAPPQGRCCS